MDNSLCPQYHFRVLTCEPMGETLQTRRSVSRFLVVIIVLFVGSVPLISQRLQSFAIDLEGKPTDPFRAAPGKVVVLIFVRTDCPISNRYAPMIQQLRAQSRDKAVFFLVYPSKKETAESIRKHDREFGYTFASLRDPQHILVKQSQAQITPEAAVFDSNRRLIYHGRIDNLYEDFGHARNSATTHELADAIEAAIAGRTPSANATPAVGCYISDLE